MPRKAKETGPTDTICTRLGVEETERWFDVLNRARRRDPRVSRADVIRVLVGFSDANHKLLTKDEIAYFRGEVAALRGDTETTGRKPGVVPVVHLTEKIDKPTDKSARKKQA